MSYRVNQRLKAYGLALLLVAIAAAITYAQPFRIHGLRGGHLVLLAAVAVASWYGGYGPGFLAVLGSGVFSAWVLMPPSDSIRIDDPKDVIRFSVFIIVAVLVSSLHAARECAERVLREAEQRLAFALYSTGIGCWDADIKSGRFWHSANLPKIYGRSEGGFATTYEGFFAYIHEEDRDFVRLATVRPSPGRSDYEIIHRIKCADGNYRRVKTRGQIVMGPRGNVERMVGVCYQMDHAPAAMEPSGSVIAYGSRSV